MSMRYTIYVELYVIFTPVNGLKRTVVATLTIGSSEYSACTNKEQSHAGNVTARVLGSREFA